MYHSGVSPFGGCATTLPGGKHVTGFAGRLQLPYESSSFATPASGGTIKLREAIFFIKWFYVKHGLFCSRLRGKSRAAGKGEANAVSQSAECFSCHMIQKANPVTLTLYSSPCGRYHNPRAKGPSNLRTLRPIGPVHLKNLPSEPSEPGPPVAAPAIYFSMDLLLHIACDIIF